MTGAALSPPPALTPVSFRKRREHRPRLSQPYVPGRRAKRFWTEEENEILRAHYPAGGVAACAVRLPQHHSSFHSIYQQANKLGLRRIGVSRNRTPLDFGPDMDERIRAGWAQMDGKKRGALNALADALGVPRWWLGKRMVKLGLDVTPHRKEPPWTAAEEALMGRVPLHDLDRSAAIFREHGFHRTAIAIGVKAKRMALSRRATHTTLSAVAAAGIAGFDPKNLGTMIHRGEIAAVRRDDRRLPQQGGSRWMIEKDELRRFIVANLERIDLRKVDKFAFVDLLVGGLDRYSAARQQEGGTSHTSMNQKVDDRVEPAAGTTGGRHEAATAAAPLRRPLRVDRGAEPRSRRHRFDRSRFRFSLRVRKPFRSERRAHA